ncbi:aminoglycoside phosphotransferase family protein [Microlunatus capsulatus]|uniref:Streptomycin 6-kinase n=1 Tax=Microlunatus capsulatus TaxID=99117 RepID=A0ABS4ZCL2_9ACTN|nr:aminoglycoside phosphotransferase family protein [Microlunatus capsulatus]MBP2418795.1 streptomycin 6-kinase [Microlunatus capsulatus]
MDPPYPSGPIRLQPLTRARVASLGEVGRAWQAGLPAAVDALAQQWSLTPGRPVPGGSSSYVVRARTADGADAVLKLALPDPALAAQAATLRRADGHGYARLLAHDPARHALLLEALGPSLAQSALPPAEQLRLLADTLAEAWLPPAGHPDPPLDKAGGLHDLVARLWVEQGAPADERVLTTALDHARRLAVVDPAELVVVHGDPHPGNLLRVPRPRAGAASGWCFVDPDGFVADRAYDLGVALRDWSAHLEGPGARRRLEGWCTLLAERSGVDADRIWAWGFLERVSTGLYVRSFGAERAAAPFLRTAALLL